MKKICIFIFVLFLVGCQKQPKGILYQEHLYVDTGIPLIINPHNPSISVPLSFTSVHRHLAEITDPKYKDASLYKIGQHDRYIIANIGDDYQLFEREDFNR